MLRLLRPKPALAEVSDAELLDRFQRSGEANDLLPLYERHAELIYAVALRYLGSPQRAEDAGMEIWALLLEKLPSHRVSNFRSWLHTTVRNHCLMQLRKEKRDPLQQTDDEFVQSDRLLHLSTANETEEPGEDTRALYHCLKKLKEEQRRCVQLFYLREGESYQSIAEALALNVGQVRSHLQNGRRNLKICLEGQDNAKE
ncbi:sigma-70 family RNA polymerase sigma factor [Neolewinella lacunae]|uniref:Sigma-70 family RNA polymerase sigma factor n=1 Tax=Neolewinella lacunae TaxID=1517758 RepID=A0A923PQV0_9BACT|nr:sigma-70 family RNA polymerase sigma factor [Neolewinella lacunae]MBC6995809.1 sigma-70 family RNA polymerase sigma factor [Neolewinella lacunae]MDN3636498.1 sigma-70 family RNA polymerase sigma factor [Neolewinella lacunae]